MIVVKNILTFMMRSDTIGAGVMNMKFLLKLANQRWASRAAGFLGVVCYLSIGFLALCTVLSVLGRQSFFLHTAAGSYEGAIYAEEEHDPLSRSMTVNMGDSIHVWEGSAGRIDPRIHVGLSLMFAVYALPAMCALWFLSRVCSNIRRGDIFVEQNASCLLCYGLLQFAVAVLVPFVKLLICWLTNLVSDGKVSIATGQSTANMLVPSVACLVAAYIIQYGVGLQDEVDHTL